MKPIICQDTNETKTSYKKYLKSKHWKKVRKQYYKDHKRECIVCNKKSRLNLHHLHYKTLGKESGEELIAICHRCHLVLHSALDSEILINKLLVRFKELTE